MQALPAAPGPLSALAPSQLNRRWRDRGLDRRGVSALGRALLGHQIHGRTGECVLCVLRFLTASYLLNGASLIQWNPRGVSVNPLAQAA